MLHNVFRVSSLLLMFVIFACDEGQEMVESVIPTPAENTEQITPEEAKVDFNRSFGNTCFYTKHFRPKLTTIVLTRRCESAFG